MLRPAPLGSFGVPFLWPRCRLTHLGANRRTVPVLWDRLLTNHLLTSPAPRKTGCSPRVPIFHEFQNRAGRFTEEFGKTLGAFFRMSSLRLFRPVCGPSLPAWWPGAPSRLSIFALPEYGGLLHHKCPLPTVRPLYPILVLFFSCAARKCVVSGAVKL